MMLLGYLGKQNSNFIKMRFLKKFAFVNKSLVFPNSILSLLETRNPLKNSHPVFGNILTPASQCFL